MIIDEIIIENFGQHKKIHKKVHGSVLGLVGANGTGKSTILKALEWAIKGSISSEKNLRSCIYHIDNEDESVRADFCSVKLRFRQQGKKCEIMRKYTAKGTSTRKLVYDDEPPLKAAGKVDQKLREILGADAKAIESIVCISQGEIHKLLSGTYAERRTLFTRLMLLSHFEAAAKKIMGYKESFMGKVQDLGGLITDAEVDLESAKSREAEIAAKIAELPDVTNDLKLLTDMYGLAVDIESGEGSVTAAKQNKSEAERQLSVAKDELGGGKELEKLEQLKTREKSLVSSVADRANYKRALEAQASWYNDHQAYGKENQELESLRKEHTDSLTFDFAGANARITQLQGVQQAFVDLKVSTDRKEEASKVKNEIRQEGDQLVKVEEALKEQLTKAERDQHENDTMITLYRNSSNHQGSHCPLCNNSNFDHELIEKKLQEALQMSDTLSSTRLSIKADAEKANEAVRTQREQWAAAQQREKDSYDESMKAYEICKGHVTQEVDRELETLRKDVDSKKQAAAKLSQKEQHVQNFASRCQSSEQRFKDIATQIGHPDVQDFAPLLAQVPEASEHELEEVRAEIQKLETVGERFHRYTQAVEMWSGRIDSESKQLEDNRGKLETFKTASGLSTLARKHMHEFEKAGSIAKAVVRETSNLLEREYDDPRKIEQGQHTEAKLLLDRCQDKLKKLMQMKEDQKHQQQVAEELTQMKDAMSVDGIARTYMDYRFQQIAVLTQNHLAKLGATFSVMADPEEDLSFCFVEPEKGTIMSMTKLSGGEKVRLSVAFLLAVQELMIPDVGLLILDEPTTHVDEEGKSALRNLFMKLAQEFQETEGQIVVCDHSPILISAFEDVIELK